MHSGCQVEAVSFGKSTSSKLREAVDDFIDLDINPRKYLIGAGGSSNNSSGSFRGKSRGSGRQPREARENREQKNSKEPQEPKINVSI